MSSSGGDISDGRAGPPSRPWRAAALGLIPAAVILATISWVQVTTRSGAGGYDAIADWVTVHAAFDGLDPALPVVDLADRYGVTLSGIRGHEASVHPRTPGGLLIMSPLALADADTAYLLWVTVGALSTLILVLWVARAYAFSTRDVMVGSILVIPAGYVVSGSLEFGSLSPLVALLAFAFWRSVEKEQGDVLGGIAIGLATSLKIYPALLLVAALALRRWRLLSWGLGSIVLLNVAGLSLFGTYSIASYLHALTLAGEQWIPFAGNLSIAGLLAGAGMQVTAAGVLSLAIALGWVAFLWRPRMGPGSLLALLVTATLVGWPMVWGHYVILALPVVAWLARSGSGPRNLGVAWMVGWIILPAIWIGASIATRVEQMTLAALQLLLVAGAWWVTGVRQRPGSPVDVSRAYGSPSR